MVSRADFDLWSTRDVARILALVEGQRDRYQAILSALPVPVVIVDRERSITWANTAFLRACALGVDDLRGRSVDQILSAGSQALAIPGDFGGETVLVLEREASAAGFETVAAAEALEAAAARLAHDINNPLMIVTGYAEEVLQALPKDHALRAEVSQIQTAAARLTAIAGRLTEFVRKDAQPPVPVNLPEILSHLPLTVEPAQGPVSALADAVQLEQAILAIIGDSRPSARALAAEGRACIELRGLRARPNLTAALAAKLDSPESQAGMAFARAWRHVRQWGGDIVVSETEARIYLPASAESHTDPPTKSGAVTILVVDDESGIRELVRKILRREGYRVLEAASGEEALKAARGQPIDLLVTDMTMPGISGSELARRMQESAPRLRVLYISGYTPDEAVQRGSNFLPKPFNIETLLRKVREALG